MVPGITKKFVGNPSSLCFPLFSDIPIKNLAAEFLSQIFLNRLAPALRKKNHLLTFYRTLDFK